MNTCEGPQCSRPVRSLGLCRTHYMQQWHGKPLAPIKRNMRTVETPPGYSFCTLCENIKKDSDFYFRNNRTMSRCKPCYIEIQKEINKRRKEAA